MVSPGPFDEPSFWVNIDVTHATSYVYEDDTFGTTETILTFFRLGKIGKY